MPKQMRPLTSTNPFLRGLPVWAEAPHQGLARSQFRAFYHPPESPFFPNRVPIGNWIELTLLAWMLRPSMGWPAVSTALEAKERAASTGPKSGQKFALHKFLQL